MKTILVLLATTLLASTASAEPMFLAKQYMVWDALTRGRTNGAIVMIGWESTGNRDAESSRMKAAAFAESILPLLPTFIPP